MERVREKRKLSVAAAVAAAVVVVVGWWPELGLVPA